MSSDLILNEKLSDVILKVRNGGYTWRMPAHSLILRKASIHFEEMLDERPEDEWPKILTIVDMKPSCASEILRYTYSGQYPSDVTIDLLIASEKYGLFELRDHMEAHFMRDLTVSDACLYLEELNAKQPANEECPLKETCFSIIESHALLVFSSDMVLALSKRSLERLLRSDCLNVPDEALVFWGVWRWGRMHSIRNNRPLKDENVSAYLDDLMVLIRCSNMRCRDGIPQSALDRFDHCKCRRTRYAVPKDILSQCSTLRLSPAWEDIAEFRNGEKDILCLQLSFDRDVVLVGMTFEICGEEPMEAYSRIFRESDGVELHRQRLDCCRKSLRRISPRNEPEPWLEANIIFKEPLFVSPGIISVFLKGHFENNSLPSSVISSSRLKIESTSVRLHGASIIAVRELHLVPDVTVSWGPRGPQT